MYILFYDFCGRFLSGTIVGSLALADINYIDLSTTLMIFCFFVLPMAYCVGWLTIVHYLVIKRLDCKYGIWSLPGHLWSTYYKLPDCCWWLYAPVFVTHMLLFSVKAITSFNAWNFGDTKRFKICFNKYILASESIFITLVFLGFGYSPYIIVPAGIIKCIYFVSVIRLDKWQEIVTSMDTVCRCK